MNRENTLVFDIGGSKIRFGYGGDFYPLLCDPSLSVQYVSDGELTKGFSEREIYARHRDAEVARIVENGEIIDSESLQQYMDSLFTTQCIDPPKYAALFSEPTFTDKQLRDKWKQTLYELGFDFLGHSSMLIYPDASLACYSHELHSGIVIDIGSSATRVVPVVDGYPLYRSIQSIPYGAQRISKNLIDEIEANRKPFRTRLDERPKNRPLEESYFKATSSHYYFVRELMAADIIKTLYAIPQRKKNASSLFMMTDRVPLDPHKELEKVFYPLFFDDDSLFKAFDDCVASLPSNISRKLTNGVCLSGGLTDIPGLRKEIAAKTGYPVKQTQIQFSPGSFCVWVGGSILSTEDSFTSLCITKEKYEEEGYRG